VADLPGQLVMSVKHGTKCLRVVLVARCPGDRELCAEPEEKNGTSG
jgi:hypothetical protein